MPEYVGKTFNSKKSYPFITSEENLFDINPGEKVKVESYDEQAGLYKLLNLSIPPHWFKVSKEELIELVGE